MANINEYLKPTYAQTTQPMIGVNPNPFNVNPIVNSQGSNLPQSSFKTVDTKSSNMLNITPSAGGNAEISTPPARKIDTSDLSAGMSGGLAEVDAEIKRISEERADREKKWQDLTKERFSMEKPGVETYQSFLKESGYENALKEQGKREEELLSFKSQMKDYYDQISNLEMQKQETLGNREIAMQGRATSSWIGESALIERKYNSQIAAVSSKATGIQMEFEFSKYMLDRSDKSLDRIEKLGEKYMEFAMWDYDQRIDDLNWVKDVYKEMGDEDYREWEKQLKIAEIERDEKWKQLDYELKVKKGEATTGSVDYYANEVFSGNLKINSVPTEIQDEVITKISELENQPIPPPPDYVEGFKAYKDANYTRQQVENSWLTQYNEDKAVAMQLKDVTAMNKAFPEIKSSLDEVYGKEQGLIGKTWDDFLSKLKGFLRL